MNLDAFYAALSSIAQGINNIGSKVAGLISATNNAFNVNIDGVAYYPPGAIPLNPSSGTVANASAVATLAGASGVTTYISGFDITATGASNASVVTVTVTGLSGGTLSYTFAVTPLSMVACDPLEIRYPSPLPSSTTNTNVVVTLPALGAGNTNATVVAYGYLV